MSSYQASAPLPHCPCAACASSISADVTLLLELAEAPVDDLLAPGPSHHADWSEWFSGDWLDDSVVDELAWCVPVSTCGASALGPVLPQSPTSVDCASAARPSSDVSMDDADSVHSSVDGPSQLKTEVAMRDPRLEQEVSNVDAVKEELGLDDSVKPRHTLETLRRRQRAYETKYRKKRRSQYRSSCQEWATLEVELYTLLQQHAKAHVKDRRPRFMSLRQQYMRLVHKERALLADKMLILTTGVWAQMFEFRNYSDQELQPTHEQWAAVDRNLLGPCVIKPFRPLRFEFKW